MRIPPRLKLMEADEHANEWERIAGNTQVLLRSRIEIAAILQSIIVGDLPLVSRQKVNEQLFIAKLHRVCAEQDFIAVGYSDNKAANGEVLAAGSVLFGASHRKGHVSFMANNPVEQREPVQVIRFDFPDVLFIEQRRINKRIRVVPETRLSCIADSGGITPFDASIVDIGLSGIGVMVYDPEITLSPGTLLIGCRIDLPDAGVATVDIQVMYSTTFTLLDGRAARRAGCRFIGSAEQIDKLLKVFVLNLERRDEENDT